MEHNQQKKRLIYKKEVKKMDKKALKKYFYFSIIDSIKQYGKLPEFLRLNTTKQRLNPYIRQLKLDGIIKKVGYGTWEIVNNSIEPETVKRSKKYTQGKALEGIKKEVKKIRGHAFILTFKIPYLQGWAKRKEYLERNHIRYKPLKNMGNTIRIIYKNYKVWLADKSIVIYCPKGLSFFSDIAKDSKIYAIYDMLMVFKGLESMFNCSFKIKNDYKFKVSRQHYAKMNDNLAKLYNRNNKKLVVRNNNGVWLISDFSFSEDELEGVHKDTADKDIDNVIVPFTNDLKAHYEATGESLTITALMKGIKGNADNLAYYGENLVSHVQAIKDLSKGVEELKKAVKKIQR